MISLNSYTESLFALFSFGGIWYFLTGKRWAALLFWALSSGTRSNGILNAGFLIFQAIHDVKTSFDLKRYRVVRYYENMRAAFTSLICFPYYLSFPESSLGLPFNLPSSIHLSISISRLSILWLLQVLLNVSLHSKWLGPESPAMVQISYSKLIRLCSESLLVELQISTSSSIKLLNIPITCQGYWLLTLLPVETNP